MEDVNDCMKAIDSIISEHGAGDFLGMAAAVLEFRADQMLHRDPEPVRHLARHLSDTALSDAAIATDGTY